MPTKLMLNRKFDSEQLFCLKVENVLPIKKKMNYFRKVILLKKSKLNHDIYCTVNFRSKIYIL